MGLSMNPQGTAADGLCCVPQKYLVLINPAGGPGRAKQIYDTVVAPVLQQSNVECEAVMTEYRHHASEIVANAPLNAFDCIVAVGGDGLLSESACASRRVLGKGCGVASVAERCRPAVFAVLQGIMNRPDWEQAIQQPLGVRTAVELLTVNASLTHVIWCHLCFRSFLEALATACQRRYCIAAARQWRR